MPYDRWILIQYGGAEDGWCKLDLNSNNIEKLGGVGYTDRIVYETPRHAVFACGENNNYMAFCLNTGSMKVIDGEHVQTYVANGNGKHFYAWKEVGGDYKIVLGEIDADTLAPLADTTDVIAPGIRNDMDSLVIGRSSQFLVYAPNTAEKNYICYNWSGEYVSEFRAPEIVTEDYSQMQTLLYEKGGEEFVIMTFSLRPKHEVVICQYCLSTGKLSWQLQMNSPRNGNAFVLSGDYLLHSLGAEGCKTPDSEGDDNYQHESRQIDLGTGEIGHFIDEPIAHWLCSSTSGVYYSLLNKGRSYISYGEY